MSRLNFHRPASPCKPATGVQPENFKKTSRRNVDILKSFTGYNWRQSFLSFYLFSGKCGSLVKALLPNLLMRKLFIRSTSLATCLLIMGVGEAAFAQGRKGSVHMRKGDGKRTVGILTNLFGKEKAQNTEQELDQRSAKGTLKIEGDDDVTIDSESSIDLDVDASNTQWAPEGRSFEQSAPSSGMLGLKDLIELALRNSAEVLNRELEIGIAEKRREAERDWEDPELRFAMSRDNDIELRRPYKTTETRYIDSNGRDVTSSVERDNIKGNTTRESSNRSEREFTTEKITQKITPGSNGDLVEETVESRSNQSRNDSIFSTSTDRSGQSSRENRSSSENTRSTRRETTRSFESNPFDPTHPDSGFRIRVRFPIPNFLERKQRLRQAAAEIGIAEAELTAARRSLIREVRDGYERIEYLVALDAFERQLLAHAEELLVAYAEQERQNSELSAQLQGTGTDVSKLVDRVRPDEIASVRGEIFELKSNLDENQRDIRDEKIALARLARIGNSDRIAFTNSLVELDVDFGKMDIGYLKAMALLKRPDLKELRFELEISESETAEEKSKRIPVINFFDIDYGQSFEFGERSKDEFSAQIGMTLPIWSLFKNKALAASKQEAAARTRELERMVKNVGSDVDLAVEQIRSARDYLLRTQESVAQAEALLNQTIAEIKGSEEDASRLPEARFDDQERVIKARQQVVRALRDYNQHVRSLEQAIGTDLDSALGKQVH
ncbi:MAG: outer membrane protein TolC [Verrucomicrobiales bacterium]|jgi:outer membrane protein TolC